jgi:predicted transcriptional regulator
MDGLNDAIRVRAEGDLKVKLKAIAKFRRRKYTAVARDAINSVVDSEFKAHGDKLNPLVEEIKREEEVKRRERELAAA